ncbi:NrfD/PsrC family molybdoenzyme membrane anchor subunit [Lutimonas sp.]|uniref:NrfD/PsrC family molybdoenzyme membrane anchor subunit n=1 Tax=Lutimonas sp. TaxID=1872403 RepID=UPI003D9B9D5D
MQEELFISGRNIPKIDPTLEVWHFPISLYLFLGGMAAGIIFFASLFTILKREKQVQTAIKPAMIVVLFALSIGLIALFYDLTHKLYVWQLYTTIRLESPMSWGAWVLLFVTIASFLWVFSYFSEIFPKWSLKNKFLKNIESFLIKNRRNLALLLLPLSLILGIYTGILLSAFNARPLWNNAILGPLFLISGLSTGAACIILFSKSHAERTLFSKIDLALIIIELALIVHMIMGMYAGSAVQLEALDILIGGEYTVMFFVFVIILGLIFPAILEGIELLGYKVPVIIPAVLILIGGLIFRMVMIEAGQLTRYLY